MDSSLSVVCLFHIDHNNSFRNLRIISTLPTQSSSYFITVDTFDVEFVIIKKGEIENLGISKEQRFLAGATPKERKAVSDYRIASSFL
ncbi:hypothetical protein Lal_00014114 [Lupinus albus]|nr:hypothetical protein Lal_00014114 [Lupinus albus]